MKEIILKNWESIQKEFNKFNTINDHFGGYDRFKDFYIFRGQQYSSWQLTSTLERSQLSDSIDNILFEFQQKSDLFNISNSINGSKLELFSLMRHYGVPSPLIDFSFSPYIALFFALKDFLNDSYYNLSNAQLVRKMESYRQNYSAIYCLNYYMLNKLDKKEKSIEYEKYLMNSEEEFDSFYDSETKGVRAFLPSKYNARISAQQGLLLCKSKSNVNSFENEITSESKTIRLTKYLIPQKIAFQSLYELNKMNINSSTIFPGLDGLGAHVAFKEKLRYQNQLVDELKYQQITSGDDSIG